MFEVYYMVEDEVRKAFENCISFAYKSVFGNNWPFNRLLWMSVGDRFYTC